MSDVLGSILVAVIMAVSAIVCQVLINKSNRANPKELSREEIIAAAEEAAFAES